MTQAELLTSMRDERGLTQEQVASIAGISTRQYQRYEAGTMIAKIETIKKLASAFGVPYQQLVDAYYSKNN